MKALFIIGQCIRLLNSDPWEHPTHKIIEVGKSSYLTESAVQNAYNWRFIGTEILEFTIQSDVEIVTCPNINWVK